jgi:glutamine amidotransferase
MGNRRSVQKALEHVGAAAPITREHRVLRQSDGLVLPGVGAFPLAMRRLRGLGLDALIRDRVDEGVPMLGICLGMQLLFERSEELEVSEGLGLISGQVTRLDAHGRRIPHIAWNEVRWDREGTLIRGLPEQGCSFYHVHSFAARPASPEDIVASTEYGERFATIVERGPVSGVQFHPEKSSSNGLKLLSNFVEVCAGGSGSRARGSAPALPTRA